MFRLYFALTLLLVAAGIFCIIKAESTLFWASGLILVTIGAGAFSAGIMARVNQ
ncbi:hypothetical protein [Arthrobacter sp. efr-133-TYG-118]|uniref:hypothetical protein n=1 Tax=Arthrobacter sp. efr-133-TYG-118 TaxID=3040279 RepID=UPI0025518364|nr:hypothetical protein [Arthrobacter sp. efr-133-TYG-118]